MTRRARLTAFVAAAVLLLTISPRATAEQRSVLYFYQSYCESCEPEKDFAETFLALTGTRLEDCALSAYNVVGDEGQRALTQARSEYGIDEVSLPMVIVDGTVYMGAGEMATALSRDALSWRATTDSELIYLYAPACESCERASAAIEALPSSVTVRRGETSFESAVTVRRVDASAEPALADALFAAYDVPDDKRIAPAVFLARRCLSGAEAIRRDLASAVALGWAVGGVELPKADSSAKALSLLQTLGAGLAAGLNTCALSMLLLFLTVLLQADRRAGLLAFCFLAAKFVCYLLIGTALLTVMQRFDPAWLHPLSRWLMTALGALLISLNVRDALAARRGEYGRIRNQLPSGLRGRLQRIITRTAQGRVLAISAAALGFVVAAGEFLCAGQLYLMRILGALHAGEKGLTLDLLAYCLAFIAPSVAVSALVLSGRSQARVSAFFAAHMAAVKLVTAAVMLILILVTWLMS